MAPYWALCGLLERYVHLKALNRGEQPVAMPTQASMRLPGGIAVSRFRATSSKSGYFCMAAVTRVFHEDRMRCASASR